MGGTNDPSNLMELTIEEHAEAHKKLYEKYGFWQDYLAWKCLSGQITKKEIQKTKSYQGGLLTPKKKVSKYDNEGVLIEIYESVSEASEKNNILMPNMSRLLKNEKSHNGYRYRFVNGEVPKKIERYRHGLSKPIHMFDLNGNYIKSFDSTVEANKQTGIPYQNISSCALGKLKKCGNYFWRYEIADIPIFK